MSGMHQTASASLLLRTARLPVTRHDMLMFGVSSLIIYLSSWPDIPPRDNTYSGLQSIPVALQTGLQIHARMTIDITPSSALQLPNRIILEVHVADT